MMTAGTAYEYLFRGSPRNCFVLIEAFSEGAQLLGRLQGKALTVSINVSKIAQFFQMGYDFPLTFLSFEKLYDWYYLIKTEYPGRRKEPEKIFLWWVESAFAIGYGSRLTAFAQRHIFEQNPSSLIRTLGVTADLVRDSYDLYCCDFTAISEGKVRWDSNEMLLLCKRVSALLLTLISALSLYKGSSKTAPLFSLFLKSVYVGADFMAHPHPDRYKYVCQD